MGIVYTVKSSMDKDQWFFARLFSRAKDDLLGWVDEFSYEVHHNNGNGKFAKMTGTLRTGLYCKEPGVWWVDLNGKSQTLWRKF